MKFPNFSFNWNKTNHLFINLKFVTSSVYILHFPYNFFLFLGVEYLYKRDFKNALMYFKKELYFLRKSNTSDKSNAMLTYRNLAETYRQMGILTKSLKYNNLHIKESERLNDSLELQRGFCNMGNTFLDISEDFLDKGNISHSFERKIDSSFNYFQKSLNSIESLIKKEKAKHPNSPEMKEYERLRVEALFNLGSCYMVKSQYDNVFYEKSMEFFMLARDYANSIKYQLFVGKANFQIGTIYLCTKRYEQALNYLLKDEKVCLEEKEYNGLRLTYQNIGLALQKQKKFDEAEKYFRKALKVLDNYFPNDLPSRKESSLKLQDLLAVKERCLKISMELKQFYQKNNWNSCIVIRLLKSLIEIENYIDANKLLNLYLKNENLEENDTRLIFSLMHYGGKIEVNLKNYTKAQEYFQKAEEIYSVKEKIKSKSEEYIVFLVDYGNFLDDLKASSTMIEKIYWKAYEEAQSFGDQENMKIILGNLESLYDSHSDLIKRDQVKDKLKEFTIEIEEEDDSFSSISLESDDEEEEERNYNDINILDKKEKYLEEFPKEEIYHEKIKEIKPQEKQLKVIKNSEIISFYSKYCLEHYILELVIIKTQLLQKKLVFPDKNLGDILLRPAIKCLRHMEGLMELNLSNNQLSDEILFILYKIIEKNNNLIPGLRILDLSNNPFYNKDKILEKTLDILFLSCGRSLTSLNLRGVSFSSDIFWKKILKLENLQILNCKGCNLIDFKIIPDFQNNSINFLDISGNRFSSNSFKVFLGMMKNLISLNFSYNECNNAADCDFFQDDNPINSNLKTLKLKGMKQNLDVDDKIISKIEILDLSYNDEEFLQKFLDKFADYFFREKLIGNEAKGVLKNFKLRKINRKFEFKDNIKDFSLMNSLEKVLIHQSELKTLDLSENLLNEEEIMEVLKYVTPGLLNLKLIGNKIDVSEKKNVLSFMKEILGNVKDILI